MTGLNEETLDALNSMVWNLAFAITSAGSPGRDAAGGTVSSLTEAVMGTTAGLVQIADAINNLAEAVRERD